MSDHSKSLILYGAGSPLIVDVEESCSRGGREPVAIIRNRESSVYALNTGIVVTLEQAAEKILNSEILFPQFTPGNRQVARNECAAFLQEQSGSALCDAVLADPSAQIAASCAMGAGTYVNSLAAIGGATRVGAYGLINRGCLVGHHVEFGCFVSLGPGVVIGGMVNIGKGSVIGARAVVLPQISVGENSVVAAGAVVTRDVPAHCMVAGNPAEIRKTDISGYNGLTVK